MTRRLRVLGLLAAAGALAVALAGLVLRWSRWMPLPAGASPGALESWYGSLGPDDALAVVGSATAAVLAAWLTLAIALQAAAALWGGRALRRTADRISPRSLQRLGHSLAGLSLTAGLTVAPGAGPFDPSGPEAPSPPGAEASAPSSDASGMATMVRVDPPGPVGAPTTVEPTTTAPPTTTGGAPGSPVDGPEVPPRPSTSAPIAPSTTVPAAADPGSEGRLPDPVDAPPLAGPAEPVAPRPHPPAAPGRPPAPVASIVVEPGMSFWSIAEEALAEAGSPVGQRDLHRYWLALIEANRDRLVVPGNPDLLLPGQSLVLPPR